MPEDMETSLIEGLADSGATDILLSTEFNDCLRKSRPTKSVYFTAGDGAIEADRTGLVDAAFLNWWDPKAPPWTREKALPVTTMPGQDEPLLSTEAMYRDKGYDIQHMHGYDPGDFTGMTRPSGTGYGPQARIAMRDETEGQGGWSGQSGPQSRNQALEESMDENFEVDAYGLDEPEASSQWRRPTNG